MYELLILILSINLVILNADEEVSSERKVFERAKSFSYLKDGLDTFLDIIKQRSGQNDELNRKSSDIKRTSAELIVSRGFHSQEHTVVTEDGYTLGIFRIINPYNKQYKLKPVLLWHQLILNSNLWLISSPGSLDGRGRYSEYNGKVINNCDTRLTSNLAFTLAACGYDVWLGNYRGTRYSLGHSYLETLGPVFSNYTFTELGIYDIKNTIEYIMETTQTNSIAYIGSSQGTTGMITLLSLCPSFEKHINPIILMPPVAFLGNTTSPLRFLPPLVPIFIDFKLSLGFPLFIAEILSELCSFPIIEPICDRIIQLIVANKPSYLTDMRTYAVLVSVTGDNYISTNILFQYGQFIANGRFNQFDYLNPRANFEAYGQHTAPDYPLGNIISRNLVLFRGPNDSLAGKNDVDHLISSLKVAPKDLFVVKNQLYHHIDFPLSKFNNNLINWRILQHLNWNN